MDPPFIVIVTDPGDGDEVIKRIEKQADRYELAENVWLIRSPMLVKDLGDELGIGEDQKGSGVAFRLNGSYWGRSNQNTWDWLSRGR